MKITSYCQLQRSKKALIFFLPILLFFSCGQTSSKKSVENKSQFQAVILEVEISNKNSLAILLAKDGTINRKGSGIADSTDKDFYMGVTQDKIFDTLMETVSSDLLSYCGKTLPGCDTTKQTCKVTASFAGAESDTGFVYCVNGTFNDLPRPIKEYIANAIRVTDAWFQKQKDITKKR
jgi:hypothetical protein